MSGAGHATHTAGPGVRVDGPVRSGDGTWRLTVTLTAEKPGVLDTKLVLTTDVPGEETVEVPTCCHVSAAE